MKKFEHSKWHYTRYICPCMDHVQTPLSDYLNRTATALAYKINDYVIINLWNLATIEPGTSHIILMTTNESVEGKITNAFVNGGRFCYTVKLNEPFTYSKNVRHNGQYVPRSAVYNQFNTIEQDMIDHKLP